MKLDELDKPAARAAPVYSYVNGFHGVNDSYSWNWFVTIVPATFPASAGQHPRDCPVEHRGNSLILDRVNYGGGCLGVGA